MTSSEGVDATTAPTDTVPAKRRIKIRSRATLSAWQRWFKDTKQRLPKGSKNNIEGVWTRAYGYVSRGAVWWGLGFKGEPRYCTACGQDLAPGETLVSPAVLTMNDETRWLPTAEASPREGYHTRCVTPEQWSQWLGPPKAETRRKQAPAVNDKTFQMALDEGWLTIEDGLPLEEAVDNLRAQRGLPKLKRQGDHGLHRMRSAGH